MYSSGSLFGSESLALGASAGNATGGGEAGRWPRPPWKLGVRPSDDRGDT